MTNLTYEEFGFTTRTPDISYLNASILRESIMDYVNSLPTQERKELKEDLTYNKKLYEEFSSKMYNFFSLYFINTEKGFEKKSKSLIPNMITENPHILNMYNHHLDAHMRIYGTYADLEKIRPKVKLILDKGLLKHELLTELLINENKSNKKLKI